MNRQLRPYQHDTLEALRQTLRGGVRRVMVQAPTGAGKTLLAAAIAEAAYGKGRRIAFVVPRISLIDQTIEEFYAEGIEDVGVIQADHHMADASRPVQVCSIETLRSRGIYPQADVVLYDEAHVLSKQHIRWLQDAAFQGVPFIGLSATPWAKGLGRHFETLLVMATTRDLIDQGYLSPFLTFAASHPDMSNVRVVNGEYHDGESSSAMQANGLTADIVETWKKRWGQDKTLVFGVDCAHARALQERFNEAGVPCGYQDAYTPMYERTQLKRQFHSGELRVICNVDTLTLGIDWDVRCLSLCRPTRSEMRYCLDSQTEVLTSRGWRGKGQIEVGDVVAARAEGGWGCWSRVLGTIDRPMSGNEKWIEYKAPRVDFRVTDQHGMIFAPRGQDYRIGTAEDMARYTGALIMPTAVTIEQPGVPLTDAELYFIGMMMTDGTWSNVAGSISQSERHPEILTRIEGCLRACGIGYAKRKIASPQTLHGAAIQERHARWSFNISAGKPSGHHNLGRGPLPTKTYYEHVAGITGFRHLMPFMDKQLSPALMALSRSQFFVLLQAINDGDGAKFKSPSINWTPRTWSICSGRKLFVDRLQALAAIHGCTANVRREQGKRKNPIWLISITPQDWRSIGGVGQRPHIKTTSATDELVWCVQSEAGTIVTRRNGKVTVMANCQIIGRALRRADGKDQAIILDHSDTTARLGLVTDIHHEHLHTGRVGDKDVRKPVPLPKTCPSCACLVPPLVQACPNCGMVRQAPRNNVVEADGELVEYRADHTTKGDAKKKYTMQDKASFYAQLLGYCLEHGKKTGYAAHIYKDKFGVWPAGDARYVQPMRPGSVILSYVRSRNIRLAKAREKNAEASNTA